MWLYTFAENLPINAAYKKGLPRVGCILCPEASEKYAWFVNAVYPNAIKPYNDAIINSIDKQFDSEEDKLNYLSTAGWQARKSGETLKKSLHKPPEKIEGTSVSWIIPNALRLRVIEWIKTLGQVLVDADGWDVVYHNGNSTTEKKLSFRSIESKNDCFRLECSLKITRNFEITLNTSDSVFLRLKDALVAEHVKPNVQ